MAAPGPTAFHRIETREGIMAVITISRQFGAGGITLGKMVSQRLGYTFFENEIIQMVAEKAKVSRSWAESMEKEAGGKIQRLISSMVSKRFVERLLDDQKGYIDEEVYVELLHEIIGKIAAEGNAVILGRGSQYILKDFPDTYHVLLVADKDFRVAFIEKKYALNFKAALQTVSNEDRRRINLYRKFGREDYDSPFHYHLVLNVGRIGIDRAADLMVKLVRNR
jgi:cytidylate kinase